MLAWDPDNVSDLAGYKIYYGTASGNYQGNIDVGNVTTYTLNGLTIGTTYYVAATAYTVSGLESSFSNEVMYTVPPCTYVISPSSASFAASGGTGSVSITTPPYCNWMTSSAISWIGINTGSGMGSGTISYSVSSNTGTTSRTAGLTIAGNVFTVTEAGQGQTVYTITASAGAGGSISPSGQAAVQLGAAQAFTITPNTGYIIASVTVDGVSQGPVASYAFSNVQANHTISATFKTITYTLSISKSGTGSGSVTTNPSGTVFSAGTVVTLNATANANSVFVGWSGGCTGSTSPCQVTMNSNLRVTAPFNAISNPNVTTGSATSVTGSLATLNGNVNPNGLATAYYFLWGLTTSYGNTTTSQSAGSGTCSIAVSANLSGLVKNTTYHYCLVVTSSNGTSYGADRTFTACRNDSEVDFNHDGQTDLLWRNTSTGEVDAWYMNGATTNGGVVIVPAGVVALDWEIIGTGNFHGDGNEDILWRNTSTGEVYIWQMNGTTITSMGSPGTVDLGWEIKGIGDFHGDGNADILWRNTSTGQLYIWQMNGTTIASLGSPGTVDLGWEIKGIGDFNGDGNADILWRNTLTGEVYIWQMNGTTIASSGFSGDCERFELGDQRGRRFQRGWQCGYSLAPCLNRTGLHLADERHYHCFRGLRGL